MKIYVCDYLDSDSNQIEHLIVEADDENEAEQMAIKELKTLNIPKRYLINVEEAI